MTAMEILFYDPLDLVRETLSTGYKAIDVDKYENKEKILVIGNSLKKYQGQKEKVKIWRSRLGTSRTG